MAGQHIVGERFTEFGVASDGGSFCIKFVRNDGVHGTLSLPTRCLRELIIALPAVMTRALQIESGNNGLQLAYPAASVRVQPVSDGRATVVTLVTPANLEVSFALSAAQLRFLGGAADVIQPPTAERFN
jgi:hypothetical protein